MWTRGTARESRPCLFWIGSPAAQKHWQHLVRRDARHQGWLDPPCTIRKVPPRRGAQRRYKMSQHPQRSPPPPPPPPDRLHLSSKKMRRDGPISPFACPHSWTVKTAKRASLRAIANLPSSLWNILFASTEYPFSSAESSVCLMARSRPLRYHFFFFRLSRWLVRSTNGSPFSRWGLGLFGRHSLTRQAVIQPHNCSDISSSTVPHGRILSGHGAHISNRGVSRCVSSFCPSRSRSSIVLSLSVPPSAWEVGHRASLPYDERCDASLPIVTDGHVGTEHNGRLLTVRILFRRGGTGHGRQSAVTYIKRQ